METRRIVSIMGFSGNELCLPVGKTLDGLAVFFEMMVLLLFDSFRGTLLFSSYLSVEPFYYQVPNLPAEDDPHLPKFFVNRYLKRYRKFDWNKYWFEIALLPPIIYSCFW